MAENRDPFQEQITKALQGPLDPNLFEDCVVDLLSESYPTLSLVRGGSDGGFDGSIGSDDGMYPLIVTTSDRVLANFRRNVTTYLTKAKNRPKAIVATSSRLSAKMRQNLEDEAARLGVLLVNVHDRDDLARRLYRSSRWCRKLLGLTGGPSALSVNPLNARSTDVTTLVGRDEDVRWIVETAGDKIIHGQPGIGKTFLLQSLVNRGHCLFAVSGDQERLAQALRDQVPTAIVIDDAHVRQDWLNSLRHLRVELGQDFTIIAISWPNDVPILQSTLAIPESNVRRLKLLSRDDMVVVISEAGITGPDEWVNMILDQAEGKPGLAFVLSRAALLGDGKSVWNGDVLIREAILRNQQLAQTDTLAVSAVLALAGDNGMTAEKAGEILGLRPTEVTHHLVQLSAGGVVRTNSSDHIQVRPPRLRPAVAKRYFFDQVCTIDFFAAIEQVPKTPSVVHDLITMKQLGAAIDLDFITELVEQINDRGCWCHLTYLGPQTCELILNSSEAAAQAAAGLLDNYAERSLQRLFQAALAMKGVPLASHIHPIYHISEWLAPYNSTNNEFAARRGILLGELEKWIANGDDHTGIVDALLACVLRPGFRTTKTVPGSGLQIAWSSGVLTNVALKQIMGLWPRIHRIMQRIGVQSWTSVRAAITDWCLPQRLAHKVPITRRQSSLMRWYGRRMLNELAEDYKSSRAWQFWVGETAARANLRVRTAPDSLYQAIYSDRRLFQKRSKHDSWMTPTPEALQMVNQLAAELPSMAIERINDCVHENERLGASEHKWCASQFFDALVNTVGNIHDWTNEAIRQGSPIELVRSLLLRAQLSNGYEAESCLEAALTKDKYALNAAQLVFRSCESSAALIEKSLQVPNGDTVVSDLWLYPHQIPVETMRMLLIHENDSVRHAALVGEWLSGHEEEVRAELEVEWTQAVVECRMPNSHQLREILEERPQLALEWTKARILSEGYDLWEYNDVIRGLAEKMSIDERLGLLLLFDSIEHNHFCSHVVMALLGSDESLFRRWIRDTLIRDHPLKALHREPSVSLLNLARVAAEEGYTASELAESCRPSSWGGSGPLSQLYKTWIDEYERFCVDENENLHLAGHTGKEWAMQSYKDALVEEEDREILGG